MKSEKRKKIIEPVIRNGLVELGGEDVCFVDSPGQCEAMSRDYKMCACALGRAAALTAQSAASSNWPRRRCAIARVPSMPNSSGSNGLRWRGDQTIRSPPSVTRRGIDEGEHVVAEGEVRTQIHRRLQFSQRLDAAASQPERPPHGPMRCGIAIVGDEALARSLERLVAFVFALCPTLKGVLPVSE